MLFDAMVVQVLLYEVEVWGGTTPLRARNEVEKIQKTFSCTGNWGYLNILYYHAIRNMRSAHRGTSHARVSKCITKVNNMPDHRLSKQR